MLRKHHTKKLETPCQTSICKSKHLRLHPLARANTEVKTVTFPPATDAFVRTGYRVFKGFFNIAGFELNPQTTVFPPLQNMIVAVFRRPDENLIVKNHLRSFQLVPEIEDVYVAVCTGNASNIFGVAVRNTGCIPPSEGGYAA